MSFSRPCPFGLHVYIYPKKVVKQLNLYLEGIVRQGMFPSRSTQGSEMWPSSIGTALEKSENTGWNATKLTKGKHDKRNLNKTIKDPVRKLIHPYHV